MRKITNKDLIQAIEKVNGRIDTLERVLRLHNIVVEDLGRTFGVSVHYGPDYYDHFNKPHHVQDKLIGSNTVLPSVNRETKQDVKNEQKLRRIVKNLYKPSV